MLTSELVTNAVRYTDGMLTVLIATAGRSLAVAVSDNGADGVNRLSCDPAERPDLMDEHGRGLLLLASLAGQWGVTPSAHGKTVWFRLP